MDHEAIGMILLCSLLSYIAGFIYGLIKGLSWRL